MLWSGSSLFDFRTFFTTTPGKTLEGYSTTFQVFSLKLKVQLLEPFQHRYNYFIYSQWDQHLRKSRESRESSLSWNAKCLNRAFITLSTNGRFKHEITSFRLRVNTGRKYFGSWVNSLALRRYSNIANAVQQFFLWVVYGERYMAIIKFSLQVNIPSRIFHIIYLP